MGSHGASRRRSAALAGAMVLGGLAGARAQPGGAHWVDARGQIWDPDFTGRLEDGTNDTFDGALALVVNGQSLAALIRRNPAASRQEKGDLVIGPVDAPGGLRITHRMGLPPDRSALRLITVVENRSGQARDVMIGHRSSVGGMTSGVLFPSGGSAPQQGDHAVAFVQSPPRNAFVEIFGLPGKKRRVPVTVMAPGAGGFARGSGDDANIDFGPIKVPPGRRAALVVFALQVPVGTESQAMKAFDVRAGIKDLDPSLRRIIVNLVARLELGGLDVPREAGHEILTLVSGTVLRGEARVARYTLGGAYGPVEIAADRAIAVEWPEHMAGLARLACLDGQVFAGRLEPDPIPFALRGEVLRIPVWRIRSLGYRQERGPAPPEGEEKAPAPAAGRWIALDGGDLWRLEGFANPPVAVTLYGDIEIDPARVLRIDFRPGGESVHLLFLRGGSRLSGIVRGASVEVELAGGRKVRVPFARILWAGLREPPEIQDAGPGGFLATLANGDRIVGRIAAETLRIRTELGEMPVVTARIRDVQVEAQAFPPRADVRLWDGSRLKGSFVDDPLPFQADGYAIRVDVGRVESLRQPRPAIPEEDRRRLRDLVKRLDAEDFDAREEAQGALLEWLKDPGNGLAEAIAAELRATLEDEGLSEEQSMRIEAVLSELEGSAK